MAQGLLPFHYESEAGLNGLAGLERTHIEAVAWMQLAADQGLAEAKEIASKETASLSPAQAEWVKSLKVQLVRR